MTTFGATDFSFIHLTDLHLRDTDDAQVNGQYPLAKLRCVLDRVRSMEIRPAFWLITGDLVNEGQATEYQTFMRLLPELQAFGVPILLGLGNHDARSPFRYVVLGEPIANGGPPYYHSTEIGGVNVIMLDSHVPGHVYGHLDDEQLVWLAAELAKPVAVGHLIALHHPPVRSIVAMLDPMVLDNPAALASVVAGRDNILGILSGHIHYNHVTRFQNTFSFTAPAVLYTIDPGVQKNFRTTSSSGFAIGTVRQGQLYMNTIMVSGSETELEYRQL